MAAQRGREQLEHDGLPLVVVGLDGHDAAGGVVEQAVDAQGNAPLARLQRRAVTHVAVPEDSGLLGLPA